MMGQVRNAAKNGHAYLDYWLDKKRPLARLLRQADDPERALDVCVTKRVSARYMDTALEAAQSALDILRTRGAQIDPVERLDQLTYLIDITDEPLGFRSPSHFEPVDMKIAENRYRKAQEELLAMAIGIIGDPSVSAHRRHLAASLLWQDIPEGHSSRPVLRKAIHDIATDHPREIHLCPYMHAKLPWQESMRAIFTPGIPDDERYKCLLGMRSLLKESPPQDGQLELRKLNYLLVSIAMKHPGKAGFDHHRDAPEQPPTLSDWLKRLVSSRQPRQNRLST